MECKLVPRFFHPMPFRTFAPIHARGARSRRGTELQLDGGWDREGQDALGDRVQGVMG